MKNKLAAIGIGTALLAATTAFGADIDATLDSADGSSAFNVKDSDERTLMSVTSDGNMTLNSGADNDIVISSEGTNVVIGGNASAGMRSVVIGRKAVAGRYAVAIGMETVASGDYGTAVGRAATASTNGTAVGWNAKGVANGAAVGYAANGTRSGAAIGFYAYGQNYGAAVGRAANGANNGVAVGYTANGFTNGVAVGYGSKGMTNGVAVGYNAVGMVAGTAVGSGANAPYFGVAVGTDAKGHNMGSAIGWGANASNFGLSMGIFAQSQNYGIAIGGGANGVNTNIAIGYNARCYAGSYRTAIGYAVSNGVDNTTIVRGKIYLDGSGAGDEIYYRANFGDGVWSSKAFVIDHPLDPQNKVLRHFCLEGPEVWNVYAGNAQLVDGLAVVRLPDYYSALNLVGSEIYSLTPIGKAQVWIEKEAEGNLFAIAGDKDVKVSWTVKVLRNDPACIEDLRRRPVEQLKSELVPGQAEAENSGANTWSANR